MSSWPSCRSRTSSLSSSGLMTAEIVFEPAGSSCFSSACPHSLNNFGYVNASMHLLGINRNLNSSCHSRGGFITLMSHTDCGTTIHFLNLTFYECRLLVCHQTPILVIYFLTYSHFFDQCSWLWQVLSVTTHICSTTASRGKNQGKGISHHWLPLILSPGKSLICRSISQG